jgi:hypothetical protein
MRSKTRSKNDGAARLVRTIIRRGLDPEALPLAIALVQLLDEDAAKRCVAEHKVLTPPLTRADLIVPTLR